MSHLLLLMFWCMGCSVGKSFDSFRYQVFQPSRTEPPVYVEKMETLTTYTTTWKLLTRIDLALYDNERQRLRNEIGKMFKVCTELGKSVVYQLFELTFTCEASVNQMENIIDEIENTWNTQLIPAMQKLQNNNFNLQAKYRDTFEEIMKTSSTTQHHTTFINGNLLTSNETTKLEMELEVVNKKMNILTSAIPRYFTSKEFKGNIVKQFLQDLISYSTITFLNYKVNHQNMYDLLLTGELLSSTSLLRELRKLKDIIHTEKLRLPLSHEEVSTKFYQFVNTQLMMTNKTLFFVYELPLVESTEFQLYQLQPYPRHIEESFFELLLPDITRLALNKQQKQYFDMDTIDFKNCYTSETSARLCELRIPVSSTDNSGSCAVELLTQRQVPNCKFRVMAFDHEIWFRLTQQNSWLFVLPKASEIAINCNGITDHRYVKGAGTLFITSTCRIRSDHLEIMAYAEDFAHKESVFLPAETTISWGEIINAIKIMKRNVTSKTLPRFISKYSFKLLHSASTSIDEFRVNNETLSESESEHKLNKIKQTENEEGNNSNLKLYAINATVSLAMSAIVWIIVLLSIQCRKRRNKNIVRHVKYVRERKNSEGMSA